MISQDTLAAFGVVTVALVVVLYLGYRRFVDRPTGTGDRPVDAGQHAPRGRGWIRDRGAIDPWRLAAVGERHLAARARPRQRRGPAAPATRDGARLSRAAQGIIPGTELEKLVNRRGPDWWHSAIRKGSRIAVTHMELRLTTASRDAAHFLVLVRERLAGAKFIATCTRYNREYLKEIGLAK